MSPDVDACAVREGIVTAHRCHPDRAEVNDDELTCYINWITTEETVRERKGPEKAPFHQLTVEKVVPAWSQVKSCQVMSSLFLVNTQQTRENRVACSTAALHSKHSFL